MCVCSKLLWFITRALLFCFSWMNNIGYLFPTESIQNCWSAAQNGGVLINGFFPPLLANQCGTKMGAGKDKHMYSDSSKQVQDHSQHSL